MYKNTQPNAFQGDVYTFDYYISGTINFPKKTSTAEYLNRKHNIMIPITNAMVRKPNTDRQTNSDQEYLFTTSFIAIPKSRVLWVNGGKSSPKSTRLKDVSERSLVVLYQDLFIRGSMTIAKKTRTLDHFSYLQRERKYFVEMHRVVFGKANSQELFGEVRQPNRLDFITLNLENITGVCETSNPSE